MPEVMPKHVAIIMDGNGRWAKNKNLPRSAGHRAGVERMRDIIRSANDWGIAVVSFYAFSTENWARPAGEVDVLMQLLLTYFSSEIDELHREQVRICILGDINGLPDAQRDAVIQAMERTKNNSGLQLNIALNYGGKAEILRAVNAFVDKARSDCSNEASLDVSTGDAITESAFSDALYTQGQPDVDLLIRTSGEMRTSNFLLWQAAYAEMIFNPVLWPDYTRDMFSRDLWAYAGRNRRFGKV